MGILGQQGTGADIGRTQGDPDEGTIELALSGGAELQWAVWPTNRADNTTAWGHGMASDRWTHVAVTNDGRYTDLYIDGALMGRNPLVPAIGLGSIGQVLDARRDRLRQRRRADVQRPDRRRPHRRPRAAGRRSS